MSSSIISPISSHEQQRVCHEVERYLRLAEQVYSRAFESIDVRFDIKGKTAGMYKVRMATKKSFMGVRVSNDVQRVIRFNPWLFAKYPEDSWQNTIPHEVAHYLADCLYGLRNIRPHGKEWQQVMQDLGAEPIVRASYDLSGIPVRKMRRYLYQCACREVSLTHHRHKKIVNGEQSYRCRDCYTEIVPVSS